MDKQLVINRRDQRMPEMTLEASSLGTLNTAKNVLLSAFQDVFADPVDVASISHLGSGFALIVHFKNSNMTFDEAKALSDRLDECLTNAGLSSQKIDNYKRQSPPVYGRRFLFEG